MATIFQEMGLFKDEKELDGFYMESGYFKAVSILQRNYFKKFKRN